jgi:hypothetical protein
MAVFLLNRAASHQLRYNRRNPSNGALPLRHSNRKSAESALRQSVRGNFGLSPQDLRTLRALNTPARIQKFIDQLQYQYADTALSPKRILRERKGQSRISRD